MKSGAVTTKLRLTNVFGKAASLAGAGAVTLMLASLGQIVGLIPGARYDDSYTRFGGDSSYTETYNGYSYGGASWREDLTDSEISPIETLGLFGLAIGAGAAGIAAGRSRRRQIIDLRYDVIDVDTGKTGRPADEEGEREYSRPRYESRDEYRRRTSYDDGFWAGWWMGSSGGRSRGGGFGGGSSSSSKNNKNAGAAILALAVIVGIAVASWITYKSVKLNFFGDPIPNPEQRGEKPGLAPNEKPAFAPD